MKFTNYIALLSGVALFLFGMGLMGDGLKKVAGQKLEVVLYRLTNTPFKGFLLGTGVTAAIQSSAATSVMVVGFVNSGMMKLCQAIGIVLGAILGTSVTGWVVCLSSLSGSGWTQLISTATLTGVISIIGICLRMFSKNKTHVQVGNILLGFAVLMFGMSTMSSAVSPLRENAFFLDLMTELANPLLGILFGIALGIGLHRLLITFTAIDTVMYGQRIYAYSYVVAVLITVVFIVGVNLLLRRKTVKIDMVESLKSVE